MLANKGCKSMIGSIPMKHSGTLGPSTRSNSQTRLTHEGGHFERSLEIFMFFELIPGNPSTKGRRVWRLQNGVEELFQVSEVRIAAFDCVRGLLPILPDRGSALAVPIALTQLTRVRIHRRRKGLEIDHCPVHGRFQNIH